MELTLTSRLKRAWNAFTKNRDPTDIQYQNVGMGYVYRPDRVMNALLLHLSITELRWTLPPLQLSIAALIRTADT